MKIRAVITGATGMVGEGVLLECLNDERVEAILIVGRRPSGYAHPKLREVLLPDLSKPESIENELQGYNACFFCLGTSSIGMSQGDYYSVTYTLTLNFAAALLRQSPQTVFCYISGAGTDSSERGKSMWARIKGKTENDLAKLPFRAVYNFRPGFMLATPGAKNTLKYYKYFAWLYPLLRIVVPNFVTTLREVALAMLSVVSSGYPRRILEVKDIKLAASKGSV